MPRQRPARTGELSLEDFASGISDVYPEKPSMLGAAGAGLLSVPETVLDMGGKLIDYMGATEPANRGGMRPVSGPPGQYARGPQIGAALTEGPVSELRGAQQAIYPEETRGRGGLPETLAHTAGAMAGSAPFMALGAAPAGIAFGAQNAMPLYYDIKSKTGDEEAAMWGLLFGAGVGQLERFGAEKALSGIVKKLAAPKAAAAVERAILGQAVGTAMGEAGTEVAQQGLTDVLYETLSKDDIDNWERIKAVLPPALILGGGFGAIDAALSRHSESPQATSTTTAPPTTGTEAPAAAPLPTGASTASSSVPAAASAQPEGVVASTSAPLPTTGSPTTQGGGQATQTGLGIGTPETSVAMPSKEGVASPEILPTDEQGGATLSEDEMTPEQFAADLEPEAGEVAIKQPSNTEVPVGEGVAPSGEPQKTTSIKNAVVDRELEKMGLPPAEHGEKVTDRERHAKAMEVFEKDRDAGSALIDDLEASPRAPSGDEGALLAMEVNRLIVAREKAQDAYNAEPSEANQAKIDKAIKEYGRAADVVTKAGTESSASLRIRKMMIARDYSLAAMEKAVRVAKGGKELTQQETAKIVELHKKIAAAAKAHEDYVSAATLRQDELQAENELLKAKQEAAKASPKGAARKKSIAASKAKIDEILNKLGGSQKAAAGLDPEKVVLTFQLATEYVKLGYKSFEQFATEVVRRVGETIRPYLRQAWDDANRSEDAELLRRYKSRKKTDIAKVKEKTAAGVFTTGRRETPIHEDPEAIRLKAEYEGARRQFEREKERHKLATRTTTEKVRDAAKEVLNLPRAILSAFDLSAVRRQGGFLTMAHPGRASRHINKMLQATASPKAALEVDVALRERPGYAFGEASGLQLTKSGDDIGPQEEAIRSQLSDKIPGVKASNRAYITYLNLQRATAFDALVKTIGEKPTLEEGKAIAAFVNVATGRGDVGKKLGPKIEAAGTLLWAPRYLVSRFQLLSGQPLTKGTWRTRKAVAKEYAKYVAGMGVYYGLLGMLGAATAEALDEEFDIGIDPRSADFGKIRVGNTRLDPLSGLAQVAVFVTRMVKGEKVSSSGKVSKLEKTGKPFDETRGDIALRFGRSKLGPLPSIVADVLTEETYMGEPVTVRGEAKQLGTPLGFRGVYEAMKDLGVPAGMAAGALSILGEGLQTYEPKAKK